MEGKRKFIALGANLPGKWGVPATTMRQAVQELQSAGVAVVAGSRLHQTRAVGPGLQLPYFNAAIEVRTHATPRALLRILKSIERRAGRRFGRMWGPRSLDLDLLDYDGRLLGDPRRTHRSGQLVLPHPEMHRRAFVLVPLLEIAPDWRHPRLGKTARSLLRRLPLTARRGVGRSLAFFPPSCDKPG